MTYRPTKQLTPSALATLQATHGRKSNERHWERWDERDTESVRLLSAQGYSMRAIARVMETGTAQVQGALRGTTKLE
jgi:hypothetical protein